MIHFSAPYDFFAVASIVYRYWTLQPMPTETVARKLGEELYEITPRIIF